MRDRRSKLIAMAVAAALLVPASVGAQKTIPVDVPWSGRQPPQNVELRGPASAVPLRPAASRFQGTYRLSRPLGFDPVTLVGRWGNSDSNIVFLRMSPHMEALNVPLLQPDYSECRSEFITPLLRASQNKDLALNAYYRARALFLLDNRNRCRGARRENAAKAWFDRSVELVMLHCAFRLNPEAAYAYGEFQPQYVAERKKATDAREIRCRNESQRLYWTAGQYAAAFQIGEEIKRDLDSDPRLAKLVIDQAAISPEALARNQEQLQSYLVKAAAYRLAVTQQAPKLSIEESEGAWASQEEAPDSASAEPPPD